MEPHPRYAGRVIDVHAHFDFSTLAYAAETAEDAGIESIVSVWDLQWPPRAPAEDGLKAWRAVKARVLRCHVPDLTALGEVGGEDTLGAAVHAAAREGCVGIKVWKNLGLPVEHNGESIGVVDPKGRRISVDDSRLDGLWEAAAATRMPVLIHVGDPPELWDPVTPANPRYEDMKSHPGWWYGSMPDALPLHAILEELENLVARHPDTIFIGAHFGCFISDHERWFRAYPNFHVDTAAAVSEMGKGDVAAVRQLMVDRPDRFLFGTDLIRTALWDYPESSESRRWDLDEFFARHWRFFETGAAELEHPIPEQVSWKVTGLDLPDVVLQALYHGNAERLYPLPSMIPLE